MHLRRTLAKDAQGIDPEQLQGRQPLGRGSHWLPPMRRTSVSCKERAAWQSGSWRGLLPTHGEGKLKLGQEEERKARSFTDSAVSFTSEHSITQDYEREFAGAGAPLQPGAGRAEPRDRRSIETVDLESEVRQCLVVRTAGLSPQGLVQRPRAGRVCGTSPLSSVARSWRAMRSGST